MAQRIYNLDGKTIWVAGHKELVGSTLISQLKKRPVKLLTVDRSQVDLRRQQDVESWMAR